MIPRPLTAEEKEIFNNMLSNLFQKVKRFFAPKDNLKLFQRFGRARGATHLDPRLFRRTRRLRRTN